MIRTDPGQVFSELAPIWRDDSDRATRIARRVVRHLRSEGRVLDVGCGTGYVLGRIRAEAAARDKKIGQTIGIDVADGMVERATSRRGVRALTADASGISFIDQCFDVVVATDVVRFVGDPERFVRELFRVTMPGGTIVIELVAPTAGGRLRAKGLPRGSLLRQFMDLRRSYAVADVRNTLDELGCEVSEWLGRSRPVDHDPTFLAKVGVWSGTDEDLVAAKQLARKGARPSAAPRSVVLVARVPGPRTGAMPIRVKDLPGWSPARVERVLKGLPIASGYTVVVKPLRWRTRPHVQAFCDFAAGVITIQVPQPFYAFCEDVPYRAKRIRRRRRMYFKWYRKRLWFERPDELIRYLYLHEYYHWYLREVRRKRSAAETACDRFALQQLGRGRGGWSRSGFFFS
ncbi:MAG: class I SAM-dependent methyltransferase [Actinomycetota bacterium]